MADTDSTVIELHFFKKKKKQKKKEKKTWKKLLFHLVHSLVFTAVASLKVITT